MHEVQLDSVKKVHCVGIGGIGVSALARTMYAHGKRVSGSDSTPSSVLEALGSEGIQTTIGHSPRNLPKDADVVIYSPAIPSDNPELALARTYHIPIRSYPEVLGLISHDAFTVAVAGTHGKTTTTAMIAQVLARDVGPTVIVGSLLKNRAGARSNFIPGHPKRFVVEACEYKRSFLNLHPDILVITNIDTDHLDYYKDLSDIQSAFQTFVAKVPEQGAIICDLEDERMRAVLKNVTGSVINYRAYYDPLRKLKVFGEHNQRNAAAAHAVADIFGIDLYHIHQSLQEFAGTWRRSEYKGTTRRGSLVYDDYAHHPTEIKTTLKGFRDFFKDKQLVVVFQPHLYSRTKLLIKDFAESFHDADHVCVAPIYAAREKDGGSISHHVLRDAIARTHSSVVAHDSLTDIYEVINGTFGSDTVILTMGAGDVYTIGESLVQV